MVKPKRTQVLVVQIVNFLENSFSLVYISMLRFKRKVRKKLYLHTLRELAMDCTHVTEMGSRFGASTKAFLGQILILYMFALKLGSLRKFLRFDI